MNEFVLSLEFTMRDDYFRVLVYCLDCMMCLSPESSECELNGFSTTRVMCLSSDKYGSVSEVNCLVAQRHEQIFNSLGSALAVEKSGHRGDAVLN